MQLSLDTQSHRLQIAQKMRFYNRSADTLSVIYFHDWANAYSDKNSALGKRFLENYSKRFFFTKNKNRGYTQINNFVSNHQSVRWIREKPSDDYFKLILNKPLLPNQFTDIEWKYTVKIPHAKFTGYGVRKGIYNLRYWYIVPAVYTDHWHLMHNLNMDDLFQNKATYRIQITHLDHYTVNSNLHVQKSGKDSYLLTGKNAKDIMLFLAPKSDYKTFKTSPITVVSNLNSIELEDGLKKDILNRQLLFLSEKLGKITRDKILINQTDYTKNPLYGFNQLPNFLRPFSDTFEWDMRMFKTLAKEYINQLSNTDTRQDIWLKDGALIYLMMQYVDTYYKDTKLIGNASKIWGLRSYQLSKLDFNDRYFTTYQYSASKNRDQSLLTRSDSLSNFNRLVLNKYKAGIGLDYLADYIGRDLIDHSIKEILQNTSTRTHLTQQFKDYLSDHTSRPINWFFDDFLATDHKFDYALQRIRKKKDSLEIRIVNRKNSLWPVALYGLKNDSIISKQWLTPIATEALFTHKKDASTRWILNYENKTPEINTRNNGKNTHWKPFSRPLSFKWLNDVDNPNYTQLFFEPKFGYNYYDGFMLASGFTNRNLLKKELEYTITPSYGFKSHSLTGSFKTIYWRYPKNKYINSFRVGLVGSYYHYKPDLAYNTFTSYAQVFFKRKNLRSVKGSSLSLSFTAVNREVDREETAQTEADKYDILHLKYAYSNPEIINNFLFLSHIELGDRFSKFSTDIRYRKLTNNNRQFEVRFFTGIFLHNDTQTDFFSFGINRPNDYLFRYPYYGRSETSGVFSQQFMYTDASIKAKMPVGFANQWVSAINTSIGLWRWFEIYNDVAFAKNRNQPVYFIHDQGIRLNFVHNIFELYFPVHSNNGWEISQPHYEEHIRFVFTSDIHSIVAFLKRGFM